MKKWQIITIEWLSYLLAILIFTFLEISIGGLNYPLTFSSVVGSSFGYAVVPIIITLVIFLVRFLWTNKNKYRFFANTVWITAIIAFGIEAHYTNEGQPNSSWCYLFLVPIIIGALYWIIRRYNREGVSTETSNNEQ